MWFNKKKSHLYNWREVYKTGRSCLSRGYVDPKELIKFVEIKHKDGRLEWVSEACLSEIKHEL